MERDDEKKEPGLSPSRDAEDPYRALFENNPQPMWVYAVDTHAFLDVNDAAIKHYGYTREEFLRMTILDIRPAEYIPALLKVTERRSRGLNHAGPWRHRKKDGSLIQVEIASHSIDLAGRPARLVLVTDITERQIVEEALRVAEQRAITEYERLLDRLESLSQTFGTARGLHAIFHALREFAMASTPCIGIFISLHDPHNNERTAVYAWSAGEEVDWTTLPPLPITDSPHSRAVATGQIVIEDDYLTAVTNQPTVDVGFDTDVRRPRSSLAVPMNFMGRTLGAVEVQSAEVAAFKPEHVTAMRMAANLAAVAIENVGLLERELERADQEAESDKMRSIGQLAAGVAHDFNNSLAAILGRTQLLLRAVTIEKQRRDLEVIETAALDAAETVRRIQTFARRAPGEHIPGVSIGRLINDAIQLTRTRWEDDARAQGLHYTINFVSTCEGGDEIAANPSEIREVIVNLIFNALDAMPSGGSINFRVSRDAGFIVVEVGDTGEGIPAALCERIFEPFFTTKGPQGSGLGLAVSYGIIQRLAGTIDVRSQVGHGATFIIRFPQTQDAGPLIPAAHSAGLPPRRVLVVEDEETVREVLGEILTELGQHVTMVAGAGEALQALNDNGQFDVMITDLAMPGMDGLTLAAEVRRRAPGTLIVLATGYGQSIPGGTPPPSLIDASIDKPFQISDLEAKLFELYAAGPSR
ncbi:MAG: PAS domain S-box protein [Pyrinomonadaceae bacterium]|nr:PAS domain S-box protein [Pyrinomonadaceae bacterium]